MVVQEKLSLSTEKGERETERQRERDEYIFSTTDGSPHNGRCVQYKLVRCDRGCDTLVSVVHPPPLLTTVLTLRPPRTLVLYCTPATWWTSLNTLITCTHIKTCFQGIQEYLKEKCL